MAEPAERSRPHAPGYGIRREAEGLLPWSFVEERMAAAREYWVATVDPDGRPHLTPVWGLWVDGVFYFGSGPRTRKARNLAENLNVAVHPEGDDVVILEGVAEVVTDPDPALSERVCLRCLRRQVRDGLPQHRGFLRSAPARRVRLDRERLNADRHPLGAGRRLIPHPRPVNSPTDRPSANRLNGESASLWGTLSPPGGPGACKILPPSASPRPR